MSRHLKILMAFAVVMLIASCGPGHCYHQHVCYDNVKPSNSDK